MLTNKRVLLVAIVSVVVGVGFALVRHGPSISSVPENRRANEPVNTESADRRGVPTDVIRTTEPQPPVQNVSVQATAPSPPRQPTDDEIAQLNVEQNASWLFLYDGKGKILTNARGERVLSPAGERYKHYLISAERQGVVGVVKQHEEYHLGPGYSPRHQEPQNHRHRLEPILAGGGVLGALRQGGVQVSGLAEVPMCRKLGLAPIAARPSAIITPAPKTTGP